VPTGAAARPDDDLNPRRQTARSGLCESDQLTPFAWQDGRRLWILDTYGADWVLAELLFDPQSCRYLEVRRSTYRWPREAAGALLGRAFIGGQARAEDAARSLVEWSARRRVLLGLSVTRYHPEGGTSARPRG
jgi:hypothetical protein